MEVHQIKTGHVINGKEIIAIELINNKGSLVKIFNYGTIINKFIVTNAKDEKQDIVLGFDDFSGYISENYLANYPYFGAIIGRYANRIKDAKFELSQQEFQLSKNNGEDCLHGGNEGFDKKVWDIIQLTETPHARVTFQYFSIDGEENFPGDLAVQLTFELTNNDELILTYQADTDEATPINLTHHSYFNLSPSHDKINNHIHQIYASNYLEQDDNYVVTGKLIPVVDTKYDFTTSKQISENAYDQTYVLDKKYGELTLATKTIDKNSGLTLFVYTTEPVVHFYTAKGLAIKKGKNNKNYQDLDGFCIETQHHPNAINISSFPNTILHPEQVYTQTTIYKVKQC